MIEEIKVGQKEILFARHNGKLIYPKYASTENLVLHYDFSGRTNLDVQKGIAEDLSGNGNNGVLQNFAYIDESGYLDNALIFDGIDDFITIPKPLIDLDNFTYSEGSEVLSFRGENVATVVDGVVEIGGRNLFLASESPITEVNSSKEFTIRRWAIDIQSNDTIIKTLEPSTQYICSYEVEILEKHDVSLLQYNKGTLYLYNSAGGSVFIGRIPNNEYSSAEEGDIIKSQTIFTTPSDLSGYRILVYTTTGVPGSGIPTSLMTFRNLKIEKGNVATPWTPAPEDLETTTFRPFFDKKIKSALYWNRALTDEELLQVYNTQIKRT